jgi:hydrogenase maturation protein HypF
MAQLFSANQAALDAARWRLRVTIRGAVQGVGFRPFIHRLATDLRLVGWVHNSAQGVALEVEGNRRQLEQFLERLRQDKPRQSLIGSLNAVFLDPLGYAGFEIRHSHAAGEKTAVILPDMATCPDCLREILDPTNHRHLYPFTNCTSCGPRFSIIESVPYDRASTTMKRFAMCERCKAEYDDPSNRRFHAQPNACPACGPQLELWDQRGSLMAAKHDALLRAAAAIREGQIVSVKGVGGFHIMADARNNAAVRRLRALKHREEKPFALMVPSLEMAETLCDLTLLERELLRSAAAPIVLLRRRAAVADDPGPVSAEIAPGNPCLGVMLPYSPLHHLLMRELGRPVVATSGNVSDEPICIEEQEALERLSGVADFFLVHNRPIVRQLDDSVIRVMAGREMMLRRGRGYAPWQWTLDKEMPDLLALGSHLKNTVAVAQGSEVFLSQHIGDLDSPQARDAFEREVDNLTRLHQRHIATIVCDLHPDYGSTQAARRYGKKILAVQHHHAHIFSCMAENGIDGPLLGVAWDGTGLGEDGTIWGGEFLHVGDDTPARVAHMRPFLLPGGERTVREPRRAALGVLYEVYGAAAFAMFELLAPRSFSTQEVGVLRTMLGREIRVPMASSVGRLFDAVACLLGLAKTTSFEGQAAMALEFALDGFATEQSYPVNLVEQGKGRPWQLDWGEMIGAILKDCDGGVCTREISAKFHNALVEGMIAVALRVGEEQVVLSGGCFQNRYLTERAVARLTQAGFRPYWHRRIPPNDGGIAVGQLIGAARRLRGV